jgi:predicted RNase H-like HicB family nuclease
LPDLKKGWQPVPYSSTASVVEPFSKACQKIPAPNHYLYDNKKSKMRRYLVIYEKGKDGYSAYVPDLPGCTTAGANRKEVEENIVEAITLHIEVMKEAGYPIPESTSESEMLVLS